MTEHFFFDLDNTLTPSRARMLGEHAPVFDHLCKTRDVVVVTGGAEEQIQKQIPLAARSAYYMLSQQGNHAVAKDGTPLWHEEVSDEQERAVRAFCDMLTKELALDIADPDDCFENRGSQFAYSPVGFHAPNETKYAYDPDQSKRRAILAAHESGTRELREVGIEVMPAGSTTFDFILAGKHKGYNVARLIEHCGWESAACLYLGDALFAGGNDESVIGVIATKQVKNPQETFAFITEVLS